MHAAPIPLGRTAGGRQTSSSLNSNGLLSQKIASSESNGHLPNGNGCASTRQSSECSDEERPGSASGSAKVGATLFASLLLHGACFPTSMLLSARGWAHGTSLVRG